MVILDIISEETLTTSIRRSDEDVEQGNLIHLEAMQHLAKLARVPSRSEKQSYLVVTLLFAFTPVNPWRYC